MTEKFASFGMSLADPRITWPARGSGERMLADRAGWEHRAITVMMRGAATIVDAMVGGELAVNVMLEGEGFAICIADTGYRISYSGRVFARCQDAMAAAEAMMDADSTWSEAPASGLSVRQRDLLKSITDAAEQRGEILLDRVFPT